MHHRVALFFAVWFLSAAVSPLAFAESFVYDSRGKRDPFSKASAAAAQTGDFDIKNLNLQGIIADPVDASYVLVNEEIVKKGETFSGFKLTDVTSDKIILEKEGRTFTLVLRPENDGPAKKLDEEDSKTEQGKKSM